MMQPDTVIDINDLSIGFQSRGNRHVLFEHIHAAAGQGELVALIGRNGIGKSSLLRTLLLLMKPLSGEIKLHHRSLETYTRQARSLEMAAFR